MTIDKTNSTCCVSCPSCAAAGARIREAEAKVSSLVSQALAAVRGQEAAEARVRGLESLITEKLAEGRYGIDWGERARAALAPPPEAEKKGGE